MLAILVLALWEVTAPSGLPKGSETAVMLLALTMGSAIAFSIVQIGRLQRERARWQQRATEAEANAAAAAQRLTAVFRLSQAYAEANDEREVVDLVLRLSVELVGAAAASFVPLDERGQPLTAMNFGDLPAPVLTAWVEYLASPDIRQRCGACQKYGLLVQTCPLLESPLIEALRPAPPVGIYCLPLRRGEREFGILNLYLEKDRRLEADSQAFLRTMLSTTALALESIRLRRRELAAFGQLQSISQRPELQDFLSEFLENVRETLKADFACLLLTERAGEPPSTALTCGDLPPDSLPYMEDLLQGVLSSGQPLSLGSASNGKPGEVRLQALYAVPLLPQEGMALGAVLVGSGRAQGFSHRQQTLLQTLASQAALLVQNTRRLAAMEYRTMMEERSRLAREIHDGLAQTLGFLKLVAAQMQQFLQRGEIDRLEESLKDAYRTLSEAYLDARQAIDGLRISPTEEGLSGWLKQAALEFEESSGLKVRLVDVHLVEGLAPEIQAQLIRVVQEAFSNVRKHARASQVWVSARMDGNDMVLEVRDDGVGFSPLDVPASSRYGLKGMRERTELIGAEFQVTSRPREGTTVRIRMPVQVGEAAL